MSVKLIFNKECESHPDGGTHYLLMKEEQHVMVVSWYRLQREERVYHHMEPSLPSNKYYIPINLLFCH